MADETVNIVSEVVENQERDMPAIVITVNHNGTSIGNGFNQSVLDIIRNKNGITRYDLVAWSKINGELIFGISYADIILGKKSLGEHNLDLVRDAFMH